MIDIRYMHTHNDQNNMTMNGNDYDFNITGYTARTKTLFGFERKVLGGIIKDSSNYFQIWFYIVTKVYCCSKILQIEQPYQCLIHQVHSNCKLQQNELQIVLIKHLHSKVIQRMECSCSIYFEHVSEMVVWFQVQTEIIGRTWQPFHSRLQ